MVSDLDFNQWVQYLFDHPIADPPLRFTIEKWRGDALTTAEYIACLFESPEHLLEQYSKEQLEQGLLNLGSCGEPFMWTLLDQEVPWTVRRRGLLSIQSLFEKLFAVACVDELGHGRKTASTPMNGACYMWWDIFPTYGQPEDPSRHEEDQTLLGVMQNILAIPSEACRESALHGLSHWHISYPDKVQQIIDQFLKASPTISPSLWEYALDARDGGVL